jgi:plasmid stabilization system protein ParE
MAQQIAVIVSDRAISEMAKVAAFIAEQGYPERAKRYYDRLLAFGNTLGIMPEKYAYCRFAKFKQYRCATFERKYVFVYKIHNQSVLLLTVLHGKQIK